MVESDARRVKTEGMGYHLTAQVLGDDVEDLLVGIKLIRAHINEDTALIGYYIMLCACIDDRCLHLHRSEQRTHLVKAVRAYPLQIVQSLIDSVDSLLTRSMSLLAMSNDVKHHQSLLRHSRLHTRRFTDDSHVDLRKQRQHTANTILSRNLLLG